MKTDPVLVILIPGFPADTNDSTCLPAQQRLIRGINKYFPGLHIIILAFQYPYNASTYDWYGNSVISFGGKNKGGIFRRMIWRKVTHTLDQLNSRHEIIGILSFWAGECALTGKRWAEKNQKKFYSWLMGQDAGAGNNFISRADLQGDELIAISDATAGMLRKNHELEALHTIPIGIDAAWLHKGATKKDITFFCAGSLIPLKQYHLCIPFMKKLVTHFPSAGMIIAGKGPEEKNLLHLIHENNMEQHILVVGEKDYPETLELMSRCRIFLHPSSSEGFSMTCLEALGSGAEVISFQQPMNCSLPKWHIVHTIEEMTDTAIHILEKPADTSQQFPFPLAQTVTDILSLFGVYAHEHIVQPVRCCVG